MLMCSIIFFPICLPKMECQLIQVCVQIITQLLCKIANIFFNLHAVSRRIGKWWIFLHISRYHSLSRDLVPCIAVLSNFFPKCLPKIVCLILVYGGCLYKVTAYWESRGKIESTLYYLDIFCPVPLRSFMKVCSATGT